MTVFKEQELLTPQTIFKMLNEKDEFKRFETETLLTGRTQIDSSLGANNDDFTIDVNNVLNLKNKTSYWSCPGTNFVEEQHRQAYYFNTDGHIQSYADDLTLSCPVFLPNGAVVTAAIVYGDAAAAAGIVWSLYKIKLSDLTAVAMASAAVNTADTSITAGTETIDNSLYCYFMSTRTDEFDTGDEIYGARITYTTDYD